MPEPYNIVIFEDKSWKSFTPLTLIRPVWELRCGIFTFAEKYRRCFNNAGVGFICREMMAPLAAKDYPGASVNKIGCGKYLFLNGRALISDISVLLKETADLAFYAGEVLVAAVASFDKIPSAEDYFFDSISETLSRLPRREIPAQVADYLWDLVDLNPSEIEADLKLIRDLPHRLDWLDEGKVSVAGNNGIFVESDCDIRPGVVLDSTEGSIYIDHNVRILPNAVIMGPVYIGRDSQVKAGAKIYPGVSIGPVCKVGGEVEATIIQGYSSKQHEGFLGHAYIGSWCNLGAGTENSDLKNNYASVKVQVGDRRVDTGKTFVGLFMGDHSKTGINTTFNTGAVIGVACNVYGTGFQPRFIPSFTWCDSGKFKPADFERTIKTVELVMKRREKILSPEEKAILKAVFENRV